jgi:hypothetical protein
LQQSIVAAVEVAQVGSNRDILHAGHFADIRVEFGSIEIATLQAAPALAQGFQGLCKAAADTTDGREVREE